MKVERYIDENGWKAVDVHTNGDLYGVRINPDIDEMCKCGHKRMMRWRIKVAFQNLKKRILRSYEA